MRISVKIDGSFAEIFKGEERAARVAVRGGIKAGTDDLKARWRGQITSAGFGARLAKTVRSNVFPRQPSSSAAGIVWTRAPKIIDAFDRGVTIRSPDGFWLAIPTRTARLSGGSRARKLTPAEWERRNNRRLHFVYQRIGPSFLVDKGGDPLRDRLMGRNGVHRAARRRRFREIGEIVFLLVPQVTLRKRLDLETAARAVGDRLPSLIVSNWPRS